MSKSGCNGQGKKCGRFVQQGHSRACLFRASATFYTADYYCPDQNIFSSSLSLPILYEHFRKGVSSLIETFRFHPPGNRSLTSPMASPTTPSTTYSTLATSSLSPRRMDDNKTTGVRALPSCHVSLRLSSFSNESLRPQKVYISNVWIAQQILCPRRHGLIMPFLIRHLTPYYHWYIIF